MSKQICIIHANCQGDSIKQLLLSTPAFANLFTIQKYTNYLNETVPQESLDNCAIFIYQKLASKWGENATEKLLQKLPAKTLTLCIPNMFFNGYWPLWTNQTHMAYGDLLIEYLASAGFGISEILHLYLHGDITAKYDLKHLVTLSRTREIEKENDLPITTLDIIDEFWREEQLFHTVNHPGPRLMLHVTDNILKYFGLGYVPLTIRNEYSCLEDEFIQPIHPQVARYFKLPFVTKNLLYNVYGQKLTFEEYSTAYVNCRLQSGPNKIDDFVVYLHLLAQKAQNICAA